MVSPYKKGYRISQKYSNKHTGIDLVGEDKNIYAVSSGKVNYCGWEDRNNTKKGFGLYVRILGTDGLYYYYGHLKMILENLKIGDNVAEGELIGIEGSTGNSTGSHLHLEIRKKIGVITDLNNSVNVEKLLENVNKNENKEVIDAIDKLGKVGILNSPKWWKENYYKPEALKYIDKFIISVAKTIKT